MSLRILFILLGAAASVLALVAAPDSWSDRRIIAFSIAVYAVVVLIGFIVREIVER